MRRYLFGCILLLGFLLRFVAIDKYPVGFSPDEASFGYDAYSILRTGKDQWGKTLPLVLESFGDYKSPLYSYLTIPSVWLFGMNKFSVRLPNAIIGTLAIYATFLLTNVLSKKLKLHADVSNYPNLGLFAAFLLAISPWHIMMSRGAFEANLTTLLLPLSLYFFLKGFEKPKYFLGAVMGVGLNMFSYHSAKLVTPLLFIAAFYSFRKEIFKNIGIYHKLSLTILVLFIGLFLLSLKEGSSTRILDVSIFKTSLLEASSERTNAINQGIKPLFARLIYNKYQAGFRHFFGNYITYFSPQYFFSQGPAESTYGMIPGRGVLYWFELPLIIFGLLYLLKNTNNKAVWIIITWFMLAPIPAALAMGPGYAANREVIALPAIQIICAIGFSYLIENLTNIKYKKIVVFGLGLSIAIFFCYFLFDYFVLSPQKSYKGMLYGNYEAIKYVSENYTGRNIIVSRKLSEPHIYVAFINKWDPATYQSNNNKWLYKDMGLGWLDQIPEYSLGNYTFKNINYGEYLNKNVVLVGKPEEFPENMIIDKSFSPNGQEVMVVVVDTNQQLYAQKNQ